jgi:molecular chaperone HtpG
MSETTQKKGESHEFKAEIKQLLEILVHSVYTSKDIFVRELISNAVDALEKVRFRQVQGTEIEGKDLPLEIRIETGSEGDSKKLTIRDAGIGMTEEEIRTNIGTIAHSGASAFLEQLKENDRDALSLIGKFGVGFYSVFMAAEKVVITSRSADPQAKPVVWTSDGLGTYTVETTDADVPRGTQIEISLKEAEGRFAEAATIKSAIQKYSSFVAFPIFVDGEEANKTTALWREQPSQVKEEQYAELYKFLCHDHEDPRLKLHLSVDAPIQFSALLFVPRTSTEAIGFGKGEVSLQLYVKRVLIDADNKNLLPHHLRFVRGVVESEDLPLNVSRETLQENALVFKIRETLTRKLYDLFLDLAAKKPEEYNDLWKSFGPILKEGHSDFANREKFQELLRFESSKTTKEGELTSLKAYFEGMPGKQETIYYLSGASREALERDPRLELFRKKDIEVLYLYDLADEFVLGGLDKYQDKALVSADQVKPEDLKDIGPAIDEDKKETEEDSAAVELRPLINHFKDVLKDRVIDVRKSERLVDSAACLVGDDNQTSAHMDKVMRLMNKDTELPRRVLEVNPDHALIRDLARLVENDPKDPFVEQACEQLFESAMLVDGYLADPHKLVERMSSVLGEAAALKVGKSTGGES